MARSNNKSDNGSDIGNSDATDGTSGGPESAAKEGGEIIDPATLFAELKSDGDSDEYARNPDGSIKRNRDGSPAKKRGRKAGSGNSAPKSAPRNPTLVDGVNTLSQTLMIVHMGIAGLTKFDQFALEQKEADALSNSLVNVMKEFDFTPDPRFTAVAGLVTTGAMIYGPRMYLYSDHKKEQKKKKQQEREEAHIVTQPNVADTNSAFDPSAFFSQGNIPLN